VRRAGDGGCRAAKTRKKPPQSPSATAPGKAGSDAAWAVALSETFAVPRLAGDRSAKRIRGSVSDSVTLERADIHARLSAIESRPRGPYDHALWIVADG
jgi:hypothetical protein